MDQPAIRVEHLGKRYRLGDTVGRVFNYGSLRETVAGAFSRGRRRQSPADSGSIWALQDVSFEVPHGQVAGIIGPNGAGKSTLLKILSRITRPTRGMAELTGRVGSLLEVGTGFHPELSGRENIFLNGAILGMRRGEIRRRFDAIVEFAGVARFLDTPVKRYSSGMYVRLAFAVAAHMEPDILVVDEVLAVGDAEFQKKCLGKMRAAVEEGRTVLFVSHSMAAIKGLCTRALLLEDGALIDDGPVDRVVDAYLTRASSASGHQSIPPDARRIGTGEGRIRQVSLLDLGDRPVSDVYFADPLRIAVLIEVQQAFRDGFLEIGIASRDGIRIATAFSIDRGAEQVRLDAGVFRWVADLDVALTPGAYTVAIGLHHRTGGTTIDTLDRTVDFTVLDVSREPGERHEFTRLRGFIRPRHRFHAPEQVHAVTVPIGDTHH